MIDDLGERGERAVVHERSVQSPVGAGEVPQRGSAGIGYVGAATNRSDDAVAAGAAESHFDSVLDRVCNLVFEEGDALVPKIIRFVAELDVAHAHGVPPGFARNARAGDRRIAETVGLLVAGGAADGVIPGKPL